MKKYCKGIPEHVYLVEEGAWTAGPFVKPQSGRINRKFKLVEVPMDEPKSKKTKKTKKPKGVLLPEGQAFK